MNGTVSSSEKEKTEAEDTKNMERKIFVKFNEARYCTFEERKTWSKIKNIELVSKEIELANKALSDITTNITLDLTEVNVWI